MRLAPLAPSLAAGLCVLMTLCVPVYAAGPPPPPSGRPASGAPGGPGTGPGGPPSSPPAPSSSVVSPQTHADALVAAATVARRAFILQSLAAIASDAELTAAVAPAAMTVTKDNAAALLTTVSGASQAVSSALHRDGVTSPLLDQVLAPLSPGDIQAAIAGQPSSVGAAQYLHALDDLLVRDGGVSPGAPTPTGSVIAAALRPALTAAGPLPGAGGPPSSIASPSSGVASPAPSGGATAPAAITAAPVVSAAPSADGSVVSPAILVLAGIIALAAVVALGGTALRRHREPRAPAIDGLLDVSRRLTSASASGVGIDVALMREAGRLVPFQAAAVIARRGGRLVIAAETSPGLLVEERLLDGMIGRVADTGQSAVTVSATDPAVRQLPVALAIVPLVVEGMVASVLILIRPASQPFTLGERDDLVAMAPVAAAAVNTARQARQAVEASLSDPLTGVANRRRLDTDLPAVLAGSDGASVLMIDIDHFKRVNDDHGHPAGDALLSGVARQMRDVVAARGTVYRYGGEEFCVVMSGSDITAGMAIAEEIRSTIADLHFETGGRVALRVTVSIGVATAASGSGADVVGRADAALYRAKHEGRNRVVLWAAVSATPPSSDAAVPDGTLVPAEAATAEPL